MAHQLRKLTLPRTARGFTMIELIMVIVITGVLAATASIFVQPALNAYLAAKRRASMSGVADTAFRRMARDIRQAVPNSVLLPAANNLCLVMVPTSTGGRYREATDTVNGASTPLLIAQPSTGFDVLGAGTASTVPSVNDWVVIGNQNPLDIYTSPNVDKAQITSVTTPSSAVSQYTLGFASQQFPPGYAGGRFVVVPYNNGNPVLGYVCSPQPGTDANGNGTGTLYRVSLPFSSIGSTYPASCPSVAGGTVAATNVSYCYFDYSVSQDGTLQSGYAYLQLQITQSHETVSLDYGVHVDNVP